jgi:hypothetical protein
MQKTPVYTNQDPADVSGRDILETSRHAALESAANLLEAVAHAKKLKRHASAALEERTQLEEGDANGEPRDILFDILRLNATYLNEFAKLGTRHKDLFHRALENLYSNIAANSKQPTANELEFNRKNLERAFVVRNDAAPEQDVACIEWVSVLGKPKDDPLSFKIGKKISQHRTSVDCSICGIHHESCFIHVPARFGVPVVINLAIDRKSLLERVYRTELKVTLRLDQQRRQIRRIPVTINMRKALGNR